MKKEKNEDLVIFHPNLARAIKGLVPVFGNNEDRLIVLAMNKLHRKISSIDHKGFRITEKNRKTESLTAKMKEIQNEERSLTNRITKRNLDF